MTEFLFFLYLVSGFIKGVLVAYGIRFPIDLTLLSGGLVLLYVLSQRGLKAWMKHLRATFLKEKRILTIWIAFILLVFFSTFFWSPSKDYAHWKSIAFLTNVLAFGIPLLDEDLRPERLVKWFCGFALLYGGFTFLAYGLREIGRVDLMGFHQVDQLEVIYMQAGLVLGLSGILSLYLKRWTSAILLNLSFILLLATAARAAILFFLLLALLALLIGSGIFLKRKGLQLPRLSFGTRSRWFLGLLVGNLLLIGLINDSRVLSAPYERTWYRYELLFGISQEENGSDGSEADGPDRDDRDEDTGGGGKAKRLKDYEFALERSFEDPVDFLIGHGFGSFSLIKTGKDERGYPHNVLLEILFELGAIGLLLSFGFIMGCIYRAYMNGNYVFLVAILYFLLNIMKSYSMIDLRLMFGLLAVAAFIPPQGKRGCSLFSSRKAFQEGPS